ncbi:MAG: hypothetical protein RBS80_18445 [Thermoguttaceae bacterium]|jgi:hypothetical protein|nr:hypothetical protein [Thermoguttaceae bacterium]
MTVPVQQQIHDFATTLLERRGAVVDWPDAGREGTALLPEEVAEAAAVDADVVTVGPEASGEGLAINLAGDFLQWAGQLLEAEPRVGLFGVRDLYLKRKNLDEALARTFTWPNAKVKVHKSGETAIEYHTWWFHAAMASEDRWETCDRFSLSAASGVLVDIPDPLGLWGLQPQAGRQASAPSTYARAVHIARRRLLASAAGFLQRMDARLERDRKRLRDYYDALSREAGKKKPRSHAPPDPEKVAATKRAVELELRRKLGELDERYSVAATLRPVVLVRTEVPVPTVELSVFRKQAHRIHTVYWNPLRKQFDPLACSACGEGAFTVVFTNDDVQPLCPACAASRQSRRC